MDYGITFFALIKVERISDVGERPPRAVLFLCLVIRWNLLLLKREGRPIALLAQKLYFIQIMSWPNLTATNPSPILHHTTKRQVNRNGLKSSLCRSLVSFSLVPQLKEMPLCYALELSGAEKFPHFFISFY